MEIDDKALAALYPTMAEEKQQEPKLVITKEEDQANKLFPDMAEKPQELAKEPAKEAAKGPDKDTINENEVDEVIREHGLERTEATDAFQEFAQDANLSKDQVGKMLEMKQEHDRTEWARISDTWRAETERTLSEDDINGAKGVVAEYANDDMVKLLDNYALGNNPAIISFLSNIAEALESKEADYDE